MSLAPHHTSPIFALATGAGRSAIAVMRVSGAGCGAILERLAGALPPPRQAGLRTLRAPVLSSSESSLESSESLEDPLKEPNEPLDEALVLWFPGPRSYTGEDSFELHLHAGPAIVEAVSEALLALGARPAEAGEFTKRAVLAGKLDLTQAEAIADLVESETQAQRRQALRQASGALSALYTGWAERLRSVLARQEALIDFPDEDLPPEVAHALDAETAALEREIGAHLQDSRGELTRDGLRVVIAGAPNAGKSSLLNALSGTDAAIVTHQAGTTRDAIGVDWMCGGVRVRLTDTAGLRETKDAIEAEGVRRAHQHIAHADLVLHLLAPGEENTPPLVPGALRLRTKTDLAPLVDGSKGQAELLGINVTTPDGLKALREALTTHLGALMAGNEAPPLTRARHRAGLEEARTALQRAQAADWPELRGEELRLAMRALGRLTGAVDVEALLDTIFSQFCIGK